MFDRVAQLLVATAGRDSSAHETPPPPKKRKMFLITWLLGGTVPTRKTIKTYEYKSPPLSLFERLFLDKFWAALPEPSF